MWSVLSVPEVRIRSPAPVQCKNSNDPQNVDKKGLSNCLKCSNDQFGRQLEASKHPPSRSFHILHTDDLPASLSTVRPKINFERRKLAAFCEKHCSASNTGFWIRLIFGALLRWLFSCGSPLSNFIVFTPGVLTGDAVFILFTHWFLFSQ